MKFDAHISADELIQFVDGELSGRRAAAVEAHVTHCWRCRTRRAELERAIADYCRLPTASIPSVEGPAAKLRAAMAASAPASRNVSRAAMAACVVVMGAAALFYVADRQANYLPDSRLTPGATRLISAAQVCSVPATADDRAIPVELATAVFRQYRIQPKPRAYEVDYLITPSLGGADDVRNLWPQPYSDGLWTARIKDALEDRLRTLVCAGQVDLATAQHEIATDWVAAYRKYFRTRKPLAAHALFVKDRPWE